MNHEEVGRNSPDVTLNIIVKDLLSFFNGFEGLHGVKRRIEKKCDIKKDPEHKCWPKDKIQQAWKETIKEDIKSRTRRHWARVIILQVVKSFVCDTCEQNTAQKNRHATTDEQGYATTPNSEDRSSQSKAEPNIVETDEQGYATTPNSEDRIYQSKAELETVGAAGGDEQMFGAGKKVSKVSRLSEDSGVASGSQLSAFSTDVHDKENVRCKNGLCSTCGIPPKMKGNSEDRSTQSNAKPQQTEQTKETAEQQSGADFSATKRKWTDNAGSESLLSTSGERDDSKRHSLIRKDNGSWEREDTNKSNSQTVYIRIPFSVMSGNESPSSTDTVVPNDSPTYKLIDGVPNLTEIRKRKSYAMLYDNRTRNAAWVYEILNSETLKQEVERQNVFSVDQSIHPFYQTSKNPYQHPYVRGHLAAAANHRWCQKALEDTFLMSNISPQHEKLNIGRWKQLEQKYHKKAQDDKNDIRNVHVYSGPLYLPRDTNSGVVNYKEMRGKAVPTHFFKVIIKEHKDGKVKLKCYRMPNEILDPNEDYRVSIEDIERASGLIFRGNSCSKGETDSLRKVTWTGEHKYVKVKTKVNISTPCT